MYLYETNKTLIVKQGPSLIPKIALLKKFTYKSSVIYISANCTIFLGNNFNTQIHSFATNVF